MDFVVFAVGDARNAALFGVAKKSLDFAIVDNLDFGFRKFGPDGFFQCDAIARNAGGSGDISRPPAIVPIHLQIFVPIDGKRPIGY